MTELNDYANRSPGAASAVGVGGENTGTACATCGTRNGSHDDEDCYDYQRIGLFVEVPAADPIPSQGRDVVIEVDHRGDLFHAKSMFLEALNNDGSVNRFAYIRSYEIDEDRQDCISSSSPRGVPVHAYSVQGGCCDGLKVCITPFESKKERRCLKIHVRVYGGAAGVVQGYLRGRCEDCGYEKHCMVRKAKADKG